MYISNGLGYFICFKALFDLEEGYLDGLFPNK